MNKNRLMRSTNIKGSGIFIVSVLGCLFIFSQLLDKVRAQTISDNPDWILPEDGNGPAMWGIRNGIVFSLWPHSVEPQTGGPRGLLRIGHNFKGRTFLINFIAVEPVVEGEMEFSEISPSRVDGRLGKLMWAGGSKDAGKFRPDAITRGVITHPDPDKPDVEQLALYIFMEKFLNGAHPYLRITIRSDRPEELGLEIFHHEDSAPMQRCALTATMGNYSRARLLYLKDQVVNSGDLYDGYEDLHFIEKESYPVDQLLRDGNGGFIAMIESDESFSELSSWPQQPKYYNKAWWRYRPFYKVTQYWRKEGGEYDPSLRVRVNGRAKYWSGGSTDSSHYVDIPGGVSFENFEMRESYYPGQKFYFGITRKGPEEMIGNLPGSE